MNVLMVLWNTFPHDIRIEKEARALATDDHSVTLLCLGTGDAPERETVEGIDVVRMDPWETMGFVGRNVSRLWFTATGRNWLWRTAIERELDRGAFDAIHVHDLPLVETALAVGDDRDLPVVADLHENYPEAMRQWRTMMATRDRIEGSVFNPVWRLKRRERSAAQRADYTLCIVEEGKAHYVADCGADPERVAVVSNTVDLEAFPTDATPVEGFDDEFVVGYVGSFGAHRGLETAIDAFPALLDERPDARLLLVGDAGEDAYDAALRERCDDLGIRDRVTFTGWVDFERVPNYVAACDVPFVLHNSNPHTETTVPHKLFQYMALGKPVVVTDVRPLARPVETYDCGAVIEPGDVGAFADAVVEFGTDADLTERAGENGRQAVAERYNWAHDAARLREVYECLATGASGDGLRPPRRG